MSGTGAAIVGGSVLLSGTAVGVAVIVRKAVSEAASAARDGAWRGYSASLSLTVRPPAAKAQKPAEADPAARARDNGHALSPALADAEYLTRAEAAELLREAGVQGASERSLRRHAAEWQLDERPQPGRPTLVTAESVQRYLTSQNGSKAGEI